MALIQYRKPQRLNSPDDTYLGYTPPPIIQQPDDLTASPEEPTHFSNFQPRTGEGQFDGAPVYPAPDAQQSITPVAADDTLNTEGIDPAVAANLRTDPRFSASTLLANAARRQPMDETLPDGNPALDPAGRFTIPSRQAGRYPDDPLSAPTGQPHPLFGAPSDLSADTQPIAPVDPGGGGGQPVGVVGDGPPPSLTDKSGRPIINKTIKDPLERYTEYQQRLNDWEPPKAHGWKRYVGPILQGWAAGQRGSRSPWSGLGGAITGAITGQVAPKLTNEQWKTNQQKETQDAIDQHIEQQKSIAGIAHTQAETAKLGAPVVRPKRIVKDKNGIYRPIDAITGLGDDGKPVQGQVVQAAGGYSGWAHDARGVAHYYSKGQDTGQVDPGRDKVLYNGRLVDSSQLTAAEIGAGKEGEAIGRQNEAARQENTRIQGNISDAQAEKDKVEAALKNTAPMITKTRANPVSGLEEKYQDRNPIYVDLENRRDRLIDNMRTMNGQLKPIVTPPAKSSPPTLKPPGGYTIEGAISAWKMKPENHGKEPTKAQIADWQAKVDAKNKQ